VHARRPQATGPDRADRGDRSASRPASRRSTLLGVLAVIVLSVVVTVWFAISHRGAVSVGVRSFDLTANPAPVTFEVDKPSASAYTCSVELVDVDHAPVGHLGGIRVPTGTRRFVTTVRVPWTGRPVSADVDACERAR
jgi:hypothetical protein